MKSILTLALIALALSGCSVSFNTGKSYRPIPSRVSYTPRPRYQCRPRYNVHTREFERGTYCAPCSTRHSNSTNPPARNRRRPSWP